MKNNRTIPIQPGIEPLVPSLMLEAIRETGQLAVSGRPMFVMGGEKERYYNDTVIELDVPLQILALRSIRIPLLGHSHLEKVFIGEYPVLTGIHQVTGEDYMFGIRPELNFDWCDSAV